MPTSEVAVVIPPYHSPTQSSSVSGPRGRATAAALAALLVTLLAWGCAWAAGAEKIYRTVDEDGNVVFTDQPPHPDQPGQQVELPHGNSFTPPPTEDAGVRLETWLDQDGDEDLAAASPYASLDIVSPEDDAGLRDNAGTVSVAAAVEPDLAPGHTLQVYLDGELRQTSPVPTTQLLNVDRGTHTLELRIVDASGNTLISSPPSVFHLQRRSVLTQPARRGN